MRAGKLPPRSRVVGGVRAPAQQPAENKAAPEATFAPASVKVTAPPKRLPPSQAFAALAKLLPDDGAVSAMAAKRRAPAELGAALSEGLVARQAVDDPQLLRRLERLRLSLPESAFEVPSTLALDAARASALLGLAQQAFAQLAASARGSTPVEAGVAAVEALEGTPEARALVEAQPAFALNPALLEPALSAVPGAAEALLLLAPKKGQAPSPLTAALIEAAREATAGRPSSEALTRARERLVAGAAAEANAALVAEPHLGVTGLAQRLTEQASRGEAPLVEWAMTRPSPVIFRAAPNLQTIAFALHRLRFPPQTPGPDTTWGVVDRTPSSEHHFEWESRLGGAGPTLERVLQDFHRVASDATEYRARTLDEVIDDLGPTFAQRLDALGPNDVLLSIGARSGHAERQLYARHGEDGPTIVAADVIAPSGESYHAHEAKGPHPHLRYSSGLYLEELADAELAALSPKPGGKVVVADNYAALAYGSEPHAVLRKLSFLPPGSEVHATLPYENRCFIDRDGVRASWPEYFDAVEGYRVKSIVPNGDVYQVVLERTDAPFEAPVLELTAIEPHGGPPGRRFTWKKATVTQAELGPPRISRIRAAGLKPPLEL